MGVLDSLAQIVMMLVLIMGVVSWVALIYFFCLPVLYRACTGKEMFPDVDECDNYEDVAESRPDNVVLFNSEIDSIIDDMNSHPLHGWIEEFNSEHEIGKDHQSNT